MDSLFYAIISAFNAPVTWFGSILESSSTVSIFLAGIFIMLVYRFLLAPVLGSVVVSAASDTAKRIRGKDSKSGQNKNQSKSKGGKK